MDIDKIYLYWLKNSEEKWKTAQSLIKAKRFSDALFFCHLTLELDLKALVVLVTKNYPPMIHDLSRLALLAELEIDKKQLQQLEKINTFNLKARYDDYKFSLYKIADEEYTKKFFIITKELKLWLKQQQQNKQKKK
jgi:HEPN domain-containing protein